ncbi:hypothetical protein AF332_11215 [Sporosarcina globispora]|uniref:Uncharacterized protein n=1 Tax=Sporosarcina globispora TaxID=1459 RepID=A0A0M0GC41_SPOGL|nr:hypothetical protein [Sporosarcina globispora]KON87338.1 hypothetical protein AF332_11215 [Sporosarcina globispora]
MLMTKTVKVNITPRNKKIYLEKEYINVTVGSSIDVGIDDLPKSSGKELFVKCDYCPNSYFIRYCDYIRTKYDFFKKDACKNCWHKKRMEITNYKIENKLIVDSSARGYWSIIENIEKELKEYIKFNGFTGKSDDKEQNKNWDMISWAIKNLNLDLSQLVNKLGYEINDIQKRKPNGYIMPLEEIKSKIEKFITEYGFFPDQRILSKELKIHTSDYQKHGTLNEIRDSMGYNNKVHLVDNKGFINKSNFELITANYLIAQNIPYKREQYPFKKYDSNLNYRSDFTFYLPNNEIHVEVWGGMKTFNGQRKLYDYDSVMKEKMSLYNKYNIKLISVNPDIFYNSMGMIKKKLYSIFSSYLELPFIEVKDRLVSTFTLHDMSDEELLKEIMKFSKYKEALPSFGVMRENEHEFLYKEVMKRYDSIKDFAEKFKLITAYEARSKKVAQTLTPTN